MTNTRKLVVRLMTKLDDDSAYSNIALDKALERCGLSVQDKRFASALFYGTLERKLTLDAIISSLSNKPQNSLNHTVRNILRTGLYQLKYMDSVPDNAAVDEAVKLAKKNRNPAVPGFVNGMLREFIRNGKKLPESDSEEERLSVEYSCPLWLVKKWNEEYGGEVCREMLETSLGRAPTSVRINTVYHSLESTLEMFSGEGITFEKNNFLPDSFNIYFGGSVESTTAYSSGRFHVQDTASQLCCAVLDPQPGETVLDMCSAPGGKAFTVAERMKNEGNIFAYDLHDNRVRLIAAGARRLGLDCIRAGVNNAKEFNGSIPEADRVLCDAPCSGLGVIRRKPEIKYKAPEDFCRLPEIQYNILRTSSRYVKVGGVLVYSTCTLSRAENDAVADRFLMENRNFGSASIDNIPGVNAEDGRLTLTPSKFNSDGFFIAKFVRRR